MGSRFASRASALPPVRRPVARLAVAGSATLLLIASAAGTAVAAPADITVPLTSPLFVAAVPDPAPNGAHGDVTVAYGGSLTVHFPELATPGPETSFHLFFMAGYPSNVTTSFGTDGSDGAALTVTKAGNNTYRIEIPTLSQVGTTGTAHQLQLQVEGLTTSLPVVSNRDSELHAPLVVSSTGPSAADLSSHLAVTGKLPTVAVGAGGTIRMTLPTSSPLYRAGLTSLGDAQISVHRANAGNLEEDWGPAEPATTSVSEDGSRATVHLPDALKDGLYAIEVRSDQTDHFVWAAFLANVSPADAAPASTSASVAPVAPQASAGPAATPAPPAAGMPAAAPVLQPELQVASHRGPSWIGWSGIGAGLLLLVGGAAFLVRRRAATS